VVAIEPIVAILPTTTFVPIGTIMTHCNGCPFAADCSGPCDLDPIVSVMPKALADMTMPELRAEWDLAVDAGRVDYRERIGKYITAGYQAREDYAELYG
jgi:hypothetical protein